ncbi:hypothetical protein SAMN05421854_108175 [Amycolatopsis rubida]|uniref:Uncharacterized protein n=1 Tax=Amycolatopsis rubida TaxID=112413 RepID=A0A1I5V1G5_9PSEU|nr:hypothetical protein SAMN05421854_108175 [Amycolatopsis rubida]
MRGRVPAAGDDCASPTPRRSRARRGLAHDGRTHARSPSTTVGSRRGRASWQFAHDGGILAGRNTSAGHRESRRGRVMVGALRARHPPPCRGQLAQIPPGRGIADPAAACAQQQHRRRSTTAGSRRGRANRAGARQANPCRLGMPEPAAPVRGHRASEATEPAGTRQRSPPCRGATPPAPPDQGRSESGSESPRLRQRNPLTPPSRAPELRHRQRETLPRPPDCLSRHRFRRARRRSPRGRLIVQQPPGRRSSPFGGFPGRLGRATVESG